MPELGAAARIISHKDDARDQVEDALQQAFRLAYPGLSRTVQVLELLFGVAPETRSSLADERWNMALAESGVQSISSFRTNTAAGYYDHISAAIHDLVERPELRAPKVSEPEPPALGTATKDGEAPERDSTETTGEVPGSPGANPVSIDGASESKGSAHKRMGSRVAYAIAAALVISLAVVTIDSGWFSRRAAPRSSPPTLSPLERQSLQHIKGVAPNPDSFASRQMGFGDGSGVGYGASVIGLPTYRFNAAHVLMRPPSGPTLNSATNAPDGVGDQRRFLSVIAAPVSDVRQFYNAYNTLTYHRHTATAAKDDTIWIVANIYNNADGLQQPDCRDTAHRPDAHNVRLRMKIWSPDGKRHVIRVWLTNNSSSRTGSRADTEWHTDAVAVDTRSRATLTPDSKLSRQHGSAYFAPWSVRSSIDANRVLDDAGLAVGNNGTVYGCHNDMGLTVMLGLRQH